MNTLEKLIESGLYKNGDQLNLHLGCGSVRLDGYINIDFPQSKHPVMISNADAEADIVRDLVFPNNSVDQIRSHHLFEHFSRVIALAQLVKWQRWLKVDGVLIIETPDFISSIKQILESDYKQQMAIVRHLTGDQSASWGFHVDQWWDSKYETILPKLGFYITDLTRSTWDQWPYLSNITITAVKLKDIPLNVQIDTCFELLKDNMVSEREIGTFSIWKEQLVEALN